MAPIEPSCESGMKPRRPTSRTTPPRFASMTGASMILPERCSASISVHWRRDRARRRDRTTRPSGPSGCTTVALTASPTPSCSAPASRSARTPAGRSPRSIVASSPLIDATVPSTVSPLRNGRSALSLDSRASSSSIVSGSTDTRRSAAHPVPPIQFRKPALRRGTVNPTARWPERLEHLATLLRADALAVISATPEGPTTVFSYRLDRSPDWSTVLGPDLFARAERGAFVTAVPAGRWAEGAAYAVVAPLDSWNGAALLCGLRQALPFDAVEAASAASASRLLEMSALEGRALAETLRQSASLEERLQVIASLGDGLAQAGGGAALLAKTAQDVARRMGAGAASIMVVEGDQLRLRASYGLSTEARAGGQQRVGEGIAGWVAASGEKIVLRGRVDDERFRGSDPDAGESVVVPLREGNDVLGVLNVKRPDLPEGFSDRYDLLDAIAGDIGRALRAMSVVSDL